MTPTAEPGRIICPVCKFETEDRVCPSCGEDLSLLQECQALAIESYNLGLRLAKKSKNKSRRQHAKKWLNLAVALRADFVEPLIVLGKLQAQQKQYPEAIACWSQALSVNPSSSEPRYCLRKMQRLFGGDENLRLEVEWQEKPIRLGSHIQCTDGYKGMVTRFIPDNKGSEWTHLLVSLRRFPPQNRLLPVGVISGVDENSVFVNVRRRELLRYMPRYRADDELSRRVSDVLSKYDPLRTAAGMASMESADGDTGLMVTADNGNITLSGYVLSCITKWMAGELACSVEGVLSVNNLLVSDTELELAAAATLTANKQTRNAKLSVKSLLGVIFLEGTVDSPQARDAIEDNVLSISGVRGVINHLSMEGVPEEKHKQKEG